MIKDKVDEGWTQYLRENSNRLANCVAAMRRIDDVAERLEYLEAFLQNAYLRGWTDARGWTTIGE